MKRHIGIAGVEIDRQINRPEKQPHHTRSACCLGKVLETRCGSDKRTELCFRNAHITVR